MPPLPNVAKVIQLTVKHRYGSDTNVITRFFVRYSGSAPSDVQMAGLTAATVAGWADGLISLCCTDVSLLQVEGVDLSSDSGAAAITADVVDGTRTGSDELFADNCLVAGYAIRRRYRGGHPRGYWPFGLSGDLATAQTWSTGFLADAAAGLGTFFDDVLAGTWTGGGTLTHVNVSFYSGFSVIISPTTGRARNVSTPRNTPAVDLVTAILPRATVGSQRRRLLP